MSESYPPISLPGTEVRTLFSDHVGETFRLYVYLPWLYEESAESYPVLYALDGNLNFYRDVGSLQTAPPMIVVGIGYDTDDFSEHLRRRFRDCYVTHDEGNPFISRFLKDFQVEIRGGGGERFLSFIRDELIPFVDSEYRTKPNDRAFLGHSAGGSLGLYTLFRRTDTFNRYILLAPALYWDNEIAFDYEREYSERNSDLPVKLYVGVGGLDETPDEPYLSGAVRLHSILTSRGYEGLDVTLDVLQGIGHPALRFPGTRRGILTVFDADMAGWA